MKRRKYVIEDGDETLCYYLCGGRRRGYGMEISWQKGEISQRSATGPVFLRRTPAIEFLHRLYLGRVYPVHLNEIISDLLLDRKEKIR